MRPFSQTERVSIGVATTAAVESCRRASQVTWIETDACASTATTAATVTKAPRIPRSISAASLPPDERGAPVHAGAEREQHAQLAVLQLAGAHLLVDEDGQRAGARVA